MTNHTSDRKPAQVFALAVSEGYYKTGDLMCTVLARMNLAGVITNSERTAAVKEIYYFLPGRATLRGYLADSRNINYEQVKQVATEIYKDWDNKESIIINAPKEPKYSGEQY